MYSIRSYQNIAFNFNGVFSLSRYDSYYCEVAKIFAFTVILEDFSRILQELSVQPNRQISTNDTFITRKNHRPIDQG